MSTSTLPDEAHAPLRQEILFRSSADSSSTSTEDHDVFGDDILSVTPDRLRRVRFSPPPSLTSVFETHSSDVYDRSPIVVVKDSKDSPRRRYETKNDCPSPSKNKGSSRPTQALTRNLSQSFISLSISEEEEEDDDRNQNEGPEAKEKIAGPVPIDQFSRVFSHTKDQSLPSMTLGKRDGFWIKRQMSNSRTVQPVELVELSDNDEHEGLLGDLIPAFPRPPRGTNSPDPRETLPCNEFGELVNRVSISAPATLEHTPRGEPFVAAPSHDVLGIQRSARGQQYSTPAEVSAYRKKPSCTGIWKALPTRPKDVHWRTAGSFPTGDTKSADGPSS